MYGENIILRESGRYKIQRGNRLVGLLYHNHRLYTLEEQESSEILCMYQVTWQGLTLLDTVDLGLITCWHPRMDSHNQKVYIPRGSSCGVSVVSWDDTRLTPQPTLTCVGDCCSVAVLSPHILCVCDESSCSVNIVSVTYNTVTATLGKPTELRDETPYKIAVAGSTILVLYGANLVVYENGLYSPGIMIARPEGSQSMRGMSSDGASRFFLRDEAGKAVFILDVSGRLCGKISIDTDNHVLDCTAGDGKLWMGCWNGDIVTLSPQ